MVVTRKIIKANSFYNPSKAVIHSEGKQWRLIEDFNQRVMDKKIEFEEVDCLCGNKYFSLLAGIDRYGFIQSTVMCDKCGLVMSNPRMAEEAYQVFYKSDEYRKLYDGPDYLKKYESNYNDGRAIPIFKSVTAVKPINKISSVLEFGAGGGWNLLPFIEKGIYVQGYDYSPELVNLGRSKGIRLDQGSFDDIKGKYDVIILNHIVEHFTNLFESMNKIKEHLGDKGIIYIQVPDIERFSMWHIQNAHTYYFTLKTLQFYMDRCGLKMVQHQEERGSHLSAIFIKHAPCLSDNFLDGNPGHMLRMIKKVYGYFYLRRFLGKVLQTLGLKKKIKNLLAKTGATK